MRFVFALALWLFCSAAFAQSPVLPGFAPGTFSNTAAQNGGGGGTTACTGGYQGTGDIVSGAAVAYGLRGYLGANGAVTKVVNIRNATSGSTQDIGLTAACDLDVTTAATFAGTDATCTGSMVGTTTLTISGCSSGTIRIGDPISGAGIVQPAYVTSIGTCGAGAGSCTLNAAQTFASETVTAQAALFIKTWYDLTAGGTNTTQGTAANQAQLLLKCLGASQTLPCALFSGAQHYQTTTMPAATQPITYSYVAERYQAFTSYGIVVNDSGSHGPTWNNSANSMYTYGGSVVTVTISDSVLHAVQSVANGASSVTSIDGTETTGNFGASNMSANPGFGSTPAAGFPMNAYLGEMQYYSAIGFTGTQRNNVCHNQRIYWGSAGAC